MTDSQSTHGPETLQQSIVEVLTSGKNKDEVMEKGKGFNKKVVGKILVWWAATVPVGLATAWAFTEILLRI